MDHARLALPPVGVGDWIVVQPVPLTCTGVTPHADPQAPDTVGVGQADLSMDLFPEVPVGEADQLQVLLSAVLHRLTPAHRHVSDLYDLRSHGAAPNICGSQGHVRSHTCVSLLLVCLFVVLVSLGSCLIQVLDQRWHHRSHQTLCVQVTVDS